MIETDLFTPVAPTLPSEAKKHWAIAYLPLNAPPYRWLGMGYTKSWGYSETPSPTQIPIAGHKDTSMFDLIAVCKAVARAARCGTPDVALNWQFVADWLEAGATPELIRTTIEKQVKSMIAHGRYDGVKTLKLFDRSVRDALAREQT